jgi:hypothetical protein
MTAYRFRIKFDPDPTSLWRDVVVGSDRTLDEFQGTINAAMGLDQGHLWFVGTDEDYWNSDVKYQCPEEFEDPQGGPAMGFGEETYDAGETTVGDVVDQLALDERDRLCYLYDYGDEWRFYAILKEILDDERAERSPEVVESKGGPSRSTPPTGDVTGCGR